LKLELVKTLLENQLTITTDETERTEITNTLSEINEILEYTDRVCLITSDSVIGLLNLVTYNDYGRFRKSNGSISFEQYSELVRSNYLLDNLTDRNLNCGYCFLNDLWSDNEHFGHNNPDGTIK
jgi:hypothetical protein